MNDLLVVKAPLRISLVGGGTDIKNFYSKESGSVFSAAINKYVYIIIKKYHDQSKCILKYSNSENVKNLNEIKHPLIKNCLRTTKVWGVDIHSIADIPGGTGLGSSSSFTVALLHALNTYKGKNITKHDATYLIQDAKQQILKSNLGIEILHIIVENYIFDNVKYNFLPLDKKCKKFSIDAKFICFPGKRSTILSIVSAIRRLIPSARQKCW